MARKNPLGQIVSFTMHSAFHPIATAGKTLAIGRMVLGQVVRTTFSVATDVASAVTERSDGDTPEGGSFRAGGSVPSSPANLRPVPPINQPGRPSRAATPPFTPAEAVTPARTPAVAVPVDAPAKQQGDPIAPKPRVEARKAPSKKAAVKKPPVAKKAAAPAPAPRPVAKKAAAPAPAPRPVAKKAAAPARPVTTPADAGEPPVGDEAVDVTPADVARVVSKKASAKKAPAKKAPAKKAAGKKAAVKTVPAKKAAGKKSAAKKSTAKKASGKRAVAGPTGIRAAGGEDTLVFTSDSGDGPANASGDTGGLEQPLVDTATAKAVQSEMATGQAAATLDKG